MLTNMLIVHGPLQGVAAPFGALVLKLLPARQLEAVVAVLMVMMITIINRSKLGAGAVAAHRWLSTSTANSSHQCCKGDSCARVR